MPSSKTCASLRIVAPIAFDLGENEWGRVVPGPGTAAACDLAADIATANKSDVLLLTATVVPALRAYADVNHGRVMQMYLDYKGLPIPTVYFEAVSYNTYGEVDAAMRYVLRWLEGLTPQQRHTHPHVHVTFTVKAWHAPRLKLLITILAAHYRLPRYWFDVVTHPWPAGLGNRAHEALGMAACVRYAPQLVFRAPSLSRV